MQTLEQTLKDQEDLESLCKIRPMKTPEIHFTPNSFYGNSYIFKDYCGLPLDYPMPIVIPHGMAVSRDYVWDEECTCRAPVVWAWTKQRADFHRQICKKPARLQANTFHYLTKMVVEPKVKRHGLLFMPTHSTEHLTAAQDFNRLAEELSELKEPFAPVTVGIFYQDYLNGFHKPFEARGFKIVSPGHYYDPEYLYRLYNLFCMFEYTASNSIGSALFYSTMAGCKFFFFGEDEVNLISDGIGKCTSDKERKRWRKRLALFEEPVARLTIGQKQVVEYFAGVKYEQTPEEMKQGILVAERLL